MGKKFNTEIHTLLLNKDIAMYGQLFPDLFYFFENRKCE